jgi:hypothetical protein
MFTSRAEAVPKIKIAEVTYISIGFMGVILDCLFDNIYSLRDVPLARRDG